MERPKNQILEDLREERHFVLRHENVLRTWARMNHLLDELNRVLSLESEIEVVIPDELPDDFV